MRIRHTLPLFLAIALTACGQPTPSPSPAPSPSAVAQRHECGNLPPDICGAAIAAAVRQVPAAAGSRMAVAATEDPNALSRFGGDLVVLVSFARWDQSDLWFDPPTWVVTQPVMTSGWRVEPWRAGTLPAHFVTLLAQAGIAP